jgi:hypothetical protein
VWLNLEMLPIVPLLAYLVRPVVYLHPNPIGVEDEEGVVTRKVRFLLRWAVDPGVHVQAPPISVVDFAAAVDCECEMLDPHLEVVVLAAIGLPEAESGLGLAPKDMVLTKAEVDDLLGSAISLKPALHPQPDRAMPR